MGIIIGSARIDENGNLAGGKGGDQKQTVSPDYKGEVSMQPFYVHSKGWYILRPKDDRIALRVAAAMINACNNVHIGYNQVRREDILKYGTQSKVDTNCDCSSLVRECIKEASGKDPGNFTTFNEVSVLEKSGLFQKKQVYKSGTILYTGDVLVTKTKGHTVAVTSGAARVSDSINYYPVFIGTTTSIVAALVSVGEKDTSYSHRSKIAKVNGIVNYTGTSVQNTVLLNLLKQGKLKKVHL
jgi:hypothetical protein